MKKNQKNIVQLFASPDWGGGEQYVYDLSRKLGENGYEVTFLSKKSRQIADRIASLPHEYIALPLKGAADLLSAFRLASVLKRKQTGIIHVHHFKDAFTAVYAKIISGRKDIKIVLTMHLVKKGKSNRLYNWLYQHIDAFIFVSHLAKNEFLSTHPQVSEEKITVIHNSVPPLDESAAAVDVHERFGIDRDALILGFTGRIHPEKGLEVLLEALARFSGRKFRLLIIGTGEPAYTERLKALAKAYGIEENLVFCGSVSPVSSILSGVDIGILPSVVPESFGLAAIEYMQAGKPVITTDNGAQKEFIHDQENGLLIPPGDSQALAERLTALADNPELRERLGKKARQSVEQNLSYENFYRQIIRVYERQ